MGVLMGKIFLFLFATALVWLSTSGASLSQNLTQEQTKYASQMDQFVDTLEAKVFDAIARLNGGQNLETKNFAFDIADYVVKVARGPVVEKGGFMRSIVKKAMPPMMGEPLFNRYIQIDIYPKTPLVGMLHIAMNFTYYKDGSNDVGGVMDITPGTIIEEDLAFVKSAMDELFAKHGVDIKPHREPLLHGHHKDWLKGSCVGVSFYLRPSLQINEKNFTLVKESVETFLDTYIKVLRKRKDKKFTDKDIEAMFDMRKRWLEKQFFWDPFASTGLYPYEVHSFQDLPPAVRF
jgi:coproporphyrinogen III oxidase